MTTYGAKSSNGRINWVLDKGRLTEIGPSSPKFTMSAIDTKILFGLLATGAEDIVKYAEQELTGFLPKQVPWEEDYAEGEEYTCLMVG